MLLHCFSQQSELETRVVLPRPQEQDTCSNEQEPTAQDQHAISQEQTSFALEPENCALEQEPENCALEQKSDICALVQIPSALEQEGFALNEGYVESGKSSPLHVIVCDIIISVGMAMICTSFACFLVYNSFLNVAWG